MTKERKAFNKLVDKFLEERRESARGGYARFTDDDLECLDGIIEALIDLKADRDADAAQSLRWTIEERYKYDRNHWLHVPHIKADESNIEEVVNLQLFNVSMAIDKARKTMKLRGFYQANHHPAGGKKP